MHKEISMKTQHKIINVFNQVLTNTTTLKTVNYCTRIQINLLQTTRKIVVCNCQILGTPHQCNVFSGYSASITPKERSPEVVGANYVIV